MSEFMDFDEEGAPTDLEEFGRLYLETTAELLAEAADLIKSQRLPIKIASLENQTFPFLSTYPYPSNFGLSLKEICFPGNGDYKSIEPSHFIPYIRETIALPLAMNVIQREVAVNREELWWYYESTEIDTPQVKEYIGKECFDIYQNFDEEFKGSDFSAKTLPEKIRQVIAYDLLPIIGFNIRDEVQEAQSMASMLAVEWKELFDPGPRLSFRICAEGFNKIPFTEESMVYTAHILACLAYDMEAIIAALPIRGSMSAVLEQRDAWYNKIIKPARPDMVAPFRENIDYKS